MTNYNDYRQNPKNIELKAQGSSYRIEKCIVPACGEEFLRFYKAPYRKKCNYCYRGGGFPILQDEE